jgi:hypothetical protein
MSCGGWNSMVTGDSVVSRLMYETGPGNGRFGFMHWFEVGKDRTGHTGVWGKNLGAKVE